MGLLGFFKKKEQFDEQELLQELKAFSWQAIDLAKPEIVGTGSFLPFGASLNTENVFQQIIYINPEAKSIDHREHATIIQNLVKKKSKEADCKLIMMAFDGIAHLPTGDIDAISVRMSHKPSKMDIILTYPYKLVNNKVELQDIDNPVVKKL